MENLRRRNQQKVEKMKKLGIFDKWVSNTDERTKRLHINCVQRRNWLLSNYAYLSDMIGASFEFSDCPEGKQFWYDILAELRSEI
jgi:hypothetical protein|nr:MAG TPA: hypothetical protein [Caudoviricetes sp.]